VIGQNHSLLRNVYQGRLDVERPQRIWMQMMIPTKYVMAVNNDYIQFLPVIVQSTMTVSMALG